MSKRIFSILWEMGSTLPVLNFGSLSMKRIIFCIICFAVSTLSFSQTRFLNVIDINTNTAIISVQEYSSVKIKTYEGYTYRGGLGIVSDSTISVGSDTIDLWKIVGVKRCFPVKTAVSVTGLVVGTSLFWAGVDLMNDDSIFRIINGPIGALAAIVGGTIDIISLTGLKPLKCVNSSRILVIK